MLSQTENQFVHLQESEKEKRKNMYKSFFFLCWNQEFVYIELIFRIT